MKKIINRIQTWWNSGYDIKIQTEEEIRRGGLIGLGQE